MKKLIVMATLFVALGTIQAKAQNGGGDPAQREAMMKEMKAQLVEKAKITEEQAEKVMEINRSNREKMRGFRDLSEEERTKKMEEINAENTKKYKEIPLTDEQVKAVNEYFAERRKNMQKNSSGSKGGNGNG
jgi:Spy/CpxP family protein refolding chaperone